MKILRATALVLVSVLASGVAFAAPRNKALPAATPRPAYQATTVAAGTGPCTKMVQKSAKHATFIPCTNDTPKCKAMCAK